MSIPSLRVGLVQQAAYRDKQKSLAITQIKIAELAQKGAQLILLPELHATDYFCQSEDTACFDLAETVPGPTTEFLSQLAQQHQAVIVGSVFERRMAGIYHNTAVVLEKDGSLAGIFRKMHIPDDPGFYEKFYFTPGDSTPGFQPIATSVGKLGVLICWDQWYPEAARLMALAGADILLYPTAIGWNPQDDKTEQQRQHEAWLIIQRAHAIANHLPVMACNRVGHELDSSQASAGIQFWGSSFIAGPQGELLAQAEAGETILYADLNLTHTENLRRIWPYFRDRRIDAYQGLLQRSTQQD